MAKFEFRSEFEFSVEKLFSYHEKKGVVSRLIPPWDQVVVKKEPENIIDADAEFLVNLIPLLSFHWVAKHTEYVKNKQFKDIQITGPFRKWEHTHIFEAIGADRSFLVDSVEFEPLFSLFSKIFAEKMILSKLKKTFRYRHAVTKNDIDFINRYPDFGAFVIGVAGSSGLIGSELIPFLRVLGCRLYRIVRNPTDKQDEIFFDIKNAELKNIREPLDIVINLAGEPIAEGCWTEKKMRSIYESRVVFTKQLISALKKLDTPIKHFINSSAIGFYGDSKEKLLEDSPKGVGFIPDLCRDWELATENQLFKTTILRIGVVLTPKGGALKQFIKFIDLNMGATFGGGDHFISWIAMDDLLYSIAHIIYNRLEGVFNLVAPEPITQKEIVDTISRKLRRLRILNLNKKSVELIYGKLGREVLLASSYVIPKRLLDSGYRFYFPYLDAAIDHLLGLKDE